MSAETGSETVAGLDPNELARLLRAVGMGSVTRLMPVGGGDGTDGGNGGNPGDQGSDQGGDGTGQADDDAGSDDDEDSLDGLKSAREKEREQRKAAQRELRALKKAGTQGQGTQGQQSQQGQSGQHGQPDPERAKLAQERDDFKRKLEQFQQKLLTQAVREHARAAADKLGAVDAAAVARMVRVEDVDTDDAGEPLDVADLVKELKREHPNLFRVTKGAGDGGAGTGNGGTVDPGFGPNRIKYAYEQIGKPR